MELATSFVKAVPRLRPPTSKTTVPYPDHTVEQSSSAYGQHVSFRYRAHYKKMNRPIRDLRLYLSHLAYFVPLIDLSIVNSG